MVKELAFPNLNQGCSIYSNYEQIDYFLFSYDVFNKVELVYCFDIVPTIHFCM